MRMGVLSAAPIHIEDTAALSIGTIRSKARRLRMRQPLDLLIVDYLQLATGDSLRRNGNRTQEVDEISRGLKALARELGCPVPALAQLSRAVEGRAGHVPTLADLRESGQIEADADVVCFIYREEVYNRETDKQGTAEIHVAKHRNGPLGMVPLRFEAHTTRLMNLERFRGAAGGGGKNAGAVWLFDGREGGSAAARRLSRGHLRRIRTNQESGSGTVSHAQGHTASRQRDAPPG